MVHCLIWTSRYEEEREKGRKGEKGRIRDKGQRDKGRDEKEKRGERVTKDKIES